MGVEGNRRGGRGEKKETCQEEVENNLGEEETVMEKGIAGKWKQWKPSSQGFRGDGNSAQDHYAGLECGGD